jgi:hypothetical protein
MLGSDGMSCATGENALLNRSFISVSIATRAAFVVSHGLGQYIRHHFLDTTFRGLYQANAFDMALLIPYFVVLILLASYGVHRYILVYLYYKHRKKRTTDPPGHFSDLPRVTVQLPIFNERFVVERLLDAICRMNYPPDKLDIQVLDDSTDETQAVARRLVEQYAARGCPISYHHRSNRDGYKAGALAEGMQTSKGEFIAIFDADFVPSEDFLLRTIHHFTDSKIGMVLDPHQSPLFISHRGGGDSAGWPFCPRTLRPRLQWCLFQFQRDRRSLAAQCHRTSRRLAT